MLKRESSNSISSSVVSESKVSHFSSGKENSDGNSPSDRVEKLLKKYKVSDIHLHVLVGESI